MHGRANAVAPVVSNDPVSAAVGCRRGQARLLDRMADVGEVIAHAGLGQACPERCLSGLRERGNVSWYLANQNGDGGVAVPAVDDGSEVQRDEVALFESLRARNAVHDLSINGGAEHGGVTVIAEEGTRGTHGRQAVAGNGVKISGSDAWLSGLGHGLQGLRDDKARLTHHGKLVCRLDLDAALAKGHGEYCLRSGVEHGVNTRGNIVD